MRSSVAVFEADQMDLRCCCQHRKCTHFSHMLPPLACVAAVSAFPALLALPHSDPLESNAFAPFRRAKANNAESAYEDGDDSNFYYYYAAAKEGRYNDGHSSEEEDHEAPRYYRDSPVGGQRDTYDDDEYKRDEVDTPRYDMPPYDRYDWPPCVGSCTSGQCVADKTEPGCCYVAEREIDDDGYGGGYYAKRGAGYGYKDDKQRNLLCWKTGREWKEQYGGRY